MFLFDSLISNIFTNNSDFQAKLYYCKSYMQLLESHFHFTNSLLTICLRWNGIIVKFDALVCWISCSKSSCLRLLLGWGSTWSIVQYNMVLLKKMTMGSWRNDDHLGNHYSVSCTDFYHHCQCIESLQCSLICCPGHCSILRLLCCSCQLLCCKLLSNYLVITAYLVNYCHLSSNGRYWPLHITFFSK